MKRSGSMKSRDNTAFLYERISRDDNLEGDSYSVANQKKLLTKVAKEMGYTNLVHFFEMLTPSLIQMHPTCTQIAP